MRRIRWLVLLCALPAMGCLTTGVATERSVIRAKDKVAPALVHIRPVKEVFAGGRREEVLVVGSGFIISGDGYVVTNEHVAGETKMVRCVLSTKEEMDAQVVGTDPYTDIAVLKLVTDRTDLPVVRPGSSSKLEAGQTVLALGSPHGLARSVSKGIVSVTDRYLGEGDEFRAPYNNWIQTDAAINPGNSGGPLVNLKGEVIGVNARRLTGAQNVGFAIPIDTAKEVVADIIQHGRVVRSWVGLTLQEITSKTDDPNQTGVVIADVDPLSPGAEAGLRPGDILLAVAGVPVNARFLEDLPAVRRQIADLPVGEEAVFTILRGGDEQEVRIRTVEKSDLRGAEMELPEWGFTAADLTPMIVRSAQLPSRSGVLVSGVQVGGIAGNAQLQRNDIILRIDGNEVSDLAALKRMYRERLDSQARLVMLDVKRGALTAYVLLKQGPAAQQESGFTQPDEENIDGGPGDGLE